MSALSRYSPCRIRHGARAASEARPRIRTQYGSLRAHKNVPKSGWLLGQELIAGKAAMVSVQLGKGEVVLVGFRPQHRSQAHGTYKLLFDTLFAGPPAA